MGWIDATRCLPFPLFCFVSGLIRGPLLDSVQAFGNLQSVIQIFPLEKHIMQKERAAKSYHLSAYFLSKVFGMNEYTAALTSRRGGLAALLIHGA